MITSKLPGSMGIKSVSNRGFRKLIMQSQMIVPSSRFFPSSNTTEYLMSTIDGTMPLKELNSAEVRKSPSSPGYNPIRAISLVEENLLSYDAYEYKYT
ncbi:hypothetical protein Tco_0948998 [Tanacetum coccineum]